MFGQEFVAGDLAIVALLIVLEGVLSIDNALVLGLLAKRLPKHLQRRALTYGLVGAFVFRFIAIATASFLLEWPHFKFLGGAYLLWVALKHFAFESRDPEADTIRIGPDGHPILEDADTGGELTPTRREHEIAERSPLQATSRPAVVYAQFWPTVFVIEMTDIAFAVDSIVAAIGVVGDNPHVRPNPKLWVVILGGFLGLIVMRFAAVLFIKLLERFPRFETAAYLLVTIIGLKLVIDWVGTYFFGHHVDFHSLHSPYTYVFWAAMAISFAIGFMPHKQRDTAVEGAG
jgi:YkoY family integral membrane protein